MLTDELSYHIHSVFGHTPTEEQEQAINNFCLFLSDTSPHAVMLLRGSAGTGKTTLAAAIVRALLRLKQKIILLAPTGRAAKVFSLYAGHEAFTIHRRIYRQRTAGDLFTFNLNDNLYHDTLFIIDEASMISLTSGTEGSTFGSGSLLDDLVQYVYSGERCRMMLIGDRAQLPPVGQTEPAALNADVLSAYGLQPYECDMNEVLRQSQDSGILYNATRIRQYAENNVCLPPKIRFKGFADIIVVPGDELIESLASSYSHAGIDDTIVITRSNKRANIYNQGIRRTVLDRDEELCRGDQLMIVKNNYSIKVLESKDTNSKETEDNSSSGGLRGIFNGDRCTVLRMRNTTELYGFRFADLTLQFPDYNNYELTTKAILDTLESETPALTREQQENLYNNVLEDYTDIPYKSERIQKLKADPFYNALQVKFAYAVTCHKAQGGQWAHVYVDQGYMTDDMLTSDYYHWLYTAFTRATEKLFLVNWPKAQTEDQ